jgi:2-hydroxycyclohexanecarboxyl-CoA dehydrogenase
VTANTVCPGPTETPMLAEITGAGEQGAKVIEAMRRAVPMKRLGRPDDVAAAVAFLASEQAGFITGQTLSVSGGLTMI